MKIADYFITKGNDKVECVLCPQYCLISPGKRGVCRVRRNIDGKLFSENYDKLCSMKFDPIEKKPLYNFYPGSTIFSVGSIGCNLSCKFCQNYDISQNNVDDYPFLKELTAEEIINQAKSDTKNLGIAYTYNEPTVWYEYMVDIARLAKESGLKNVMVTNGFINPEPLEKLLEIIDAFSVDLKAFTDTFYKKLTSATLKPVLNSLKQIKASEIHFEITNLVITDENDNKSEFIKMVKWIKSELGKETVLHLSRYFPTYKLDRPATPVSTLNQFYDIASEYLDYVYIGNVREQKGQDTFCPKCKALVIERSGYFTSIKDLNSKGKCKICGYQVLSIGTY